MKLSMLFVALLLLGGCASSPKATLPVVDDLDIVRYMGKWYEVARYPNSFQEGCIDSSATYTMREDGKVNVVNECRRPGSKEGYSKAEGTGWVVDPNENAKLKVSFFWPFSGDYWVVDLGSDYEYSIVSDPKRKYLWILSRTPTLTPEKMSMIMDTLEKLGFDLNKLIYNGA